MHAHDLSAHAHHRDLAPPTSSGERRTRWVVALTLVMMIGEIVAGELTGSMALTADGWHMATHAGALGLALFAYWFARTRASSRAFTFGTGKVHALAGFASGIVLAVVALWMAVESVHRLVDAPTVRFGEALWVAAIGLVVNLASAWLLGGAHEHHGHGHGEPAGHGREHEHGHADHDHAGHAHDHGHAGHAQDRGHAGHGHDHADHDHDHDHADHDHDHAPAHGGAAAASAKRGTGSGGHGGHDHNLRAAYLHVLADALTSVLAIVALVAGYYTSAWYLDPLMGVVGGVVIARWSLGLCRDTAVQLLDVMPSTELAERIERTIEADGDARVADLHLWELAPGRRGCIVAVVAAEPRAVEHYRKLILAEVELAHLTVEIHCCAERHGTAAAA